MRKFQAGAKQCGGVNLLLVAPPRRTSPPAGEARVACYEWAFRQMFETSMFENPIIRNLDIRKPYI